MATDNLTEEERTTLVAVADYQFGPGIGKALVSAGIDDVHRSRTGRIERVYSADGRLVTLTTKGRLTLGLAGGRVIANATEPPANRVVMEDEAVPFLADGKNAFAKFVVQVDPWIRPRDEVVLVDSMDEVIAVGRAELSASAMVAFERGMAVSVRRGVGT